MANKTYTTVLNQDIFDICIIIYGSFDYIVQLMRDNNIGISTYIFPGTQIIYDNNFVPFNVAFSTGELIYSPPPVPPVIYSQPMDMTESSGSTFIIPTKCGGAPINIIWQMYNTGTSSWDDLSNNATFNNVTSQYLQITGVTSALNGAMFRIQVSGSDANGNNIILTSNSMTLTVV